MYTVAAAAWMRSLLIKTQFYWHTDQAAPPNSNWTMNDITNFNANKT